MTGTGLKTGLTFKSFFCVEIPRDGQVVLYSGTQAILGSGQTWHAGCPIKREGSRCQLPNARCSWGDVDTISFQLNHDRAYVTERDGGAVAAAAAVLAKR